MRKLILQTLTLTNFKGRTFTLEAHGKNLDVWGDNATGKTTVYDAFCWLLFGKDSSFKTDFEIKTLHQDGTVKHSLCHEVKGLFKLDGKVIELKKVYQEIWTKKRGSASKEMTGHTTDNFIDSVPKSKKEYQEYVSGIATEEQFKLLTSPFYFSEVMKPADRRAFLMSLAGDISDTDVIASDPELKPLAAILAARSIDDHKKVIVAQRKEINEQLEKIPIRIDEVVKGMPDISDIIVIEEQDNLAEYNIQLAANAEKISGLKNTGALAELQRDLATADADVIRASSAIMTRYDDDRSKVKTRIRELKTDLAGKDATVINHKNEIGRQKEALLFIERNLETLRAEWKEIVAKDSAFKASLASSALCCETCGQSLPADKIESLTQAHNERISTEKASNQAVGKRTAVDKIDHKKKIESLENLIAAIEKYKQPLVEEISRLESSIQDQDNSVLELMMQSDVALEEAATRKKLIMDRIELEKSGVADDTKLQDLADEKADLEKKIKGALANIALVGSAASSVDRKALLEKERKTAAADFERLEGELYLLDQFLRAKVAMLEDEINGSFTMAKFMLFETQINGGLAPCCKVTYQGVPFETSLNNGARINVGMDIINTISRKLGMSLPLFCDNAESVTSLIPTEAQVIRLIVSEQDKVLRLRMAMAA